jgi:hypothetical protein
MEMEIAKMQQQYMETVIVPGVRDFGAYKVDKGHILKVFPRSAEAGDERLKEFAVRYDLEFVYNEVAGIYEFKAIDPRRLSR